MLIRPRAEAGGGEEGIVGKDNPGRDRYMRVRAQGRKACGLLESLKGSQRG